MKRCVSACSRVMMSLILASIGLSNFATQYGNLPARMMEAKAPL